MSEQHLTSTRNWYDKTYKILLVIPLIILLVGVIYLFQFYRTNGDIFYQDVSIKGGTTVTVFISKPINEVESILKPQFPDVLVRGVADLRTGEQQGFYVETSAPLDQIKPAIEAYLKTQLTSDNSSIEFTGSAISSSFYKQLRFALLIAFFFMAVVVFVIFRTGIPSIAVILAALADILMTVVVIDIIHLNLSLAGIVALLMLVGYSVDTDILLTTRVLRRGEGTINHRIYGAFKTGIMMTLTAIAAVIASLFFTYSVSSTLSQIFTILLIGLAFDIINTWLTNASIIKWYAEAKRL